jgi:hypothetical protein
VVDALIEADGGSYLSLELPVIHDVVVRQGLFDHYQVEVIQPFEHLQVFQSIGGICIGHRGHIRERATHSRQRLYVVARPDFDLQAPIALIHEAFGLPEKFIYRILNADAHAGFYAFLILAADSPIERDALLFGQKVPERGLES